MFLLIVISASVLGHLHGPRGFFDACSLSIQSRNTRYLKQNSGTILFEERLNIDVWTQENYISVYCAVLY